MTKITTLILLIVSMTSCQHYYYMPPAHNVPLFKEKNEFQGTISIGSGDEISNTEIQAAYSITNKFAVMSNFMFAYGGDNTTNNWGKGHYFDAAFGYYKPLQKHGVFEIFGGLGTSKQQHQYEISKFADLSFTRVFIQPTIGFTFTNFDIALTSGFSNINFHKINNQITTLNTNYTKVDLIAQNRNSFLYEPSVTIRGGIKNIKLQFQVGLSENLSHSNLEFEPLRMNLGLTFTPKLKNKNKQSENR